MKVNRIYLTGFKNLIDCEIKPTGLHALTGCNGCGKSNFIEAVQFVIVLLTGSEEVRQEALTDGILTEGTNWLPLVIEKKFLKGFKFEIDCSINFKNSIWNVNYSLILDKPHKHKTSYFPDKGPGKITKETLSIKEAGKPGPRRQILERGKNGNTLIVLESNPRKKMAFNSLLDMSSLQTLQIREASDFENKFPITSIFIKNFTRTNFIKIDPLELSKLAQERSPDGPFKRTYGIFLKKFPFFSFLKYIKKNDSN